MGSGSETILSVRHYFDICKKNIFLIDEIQKEEGDFDHQTLTHMNKDLKIMIKKLTH